MVKIRYNRDMPLHMALLVDAPDDLVISIYKAYPEAANLMSREGKSALQLAIEKRRSDKVQRMLRGEKSSSIRSPSRASLRMKGMRRSVRSSLELLLRSARRNSLKSS